jgi:hypothetical protein
VDALVARPSCVGAIRYGQPMTVNLGSIDLKVDEAQLPFTATIVEYLRRQGEVSADRAAVATAMASIIGVMLLEQRQNAILKAIGATPIDDPGDLLKSIREGAYDDYIREEPQG